jgi:DNA-binding transcriptional regulator YiaG
MANLAGVLKEEIRRLARKEVRVELAAAKTAVSRHRKEIAALKRDLRSQAKQIAVLERAQKKITPVEAPSGPPLRFSAKGLRSHRQRLGISAADYAALVGVSALTIYNWEKGKTRPQSSQLEKLAAVRGMGKREAWQKLESMEE